MSVGPSAALGVEHPHRHQLRPEGEAGEADAVVGLLGDRAGDMRAVAVFVERQAVAVDEVVALDELPGGEVGAAAEALAQGAIGDPGVEHGNGHAFGAGTPRRFQVFPGTDGVDAAGGEGHQRCRQALPGQEVPLLRDPAAGRSRGPAERAGVVGNGRFFFARRGGGDEVGRGVGDVGIGLQRGRRLTDAGLPWQVDGPRPLGSRQLDDQLVRGEAVRGRDASRGAGSTRVQASGPRAGSRRRSEGVDSSLRWP